MSEVLNRAPHISEAAFQRQVTDLARLYSFRVYHTRFSLGSDAGFPDLVLVKPASQRVIFAELKTETGKVSPDQYAWLCDLEACRPAIECYLWRPSDIEIVRQTLAGGRG